MFAYLLTPFLMIIGNDVCGAAQPAVTKDFTLGSVSTWDIDQPVQAMVNGRVVEAPFSKTPCVYVEWVIGTTTKPKGEGVWMTHMKPVVVGGDLQFHTADGRALRINPVGELFRLPATWTFHFGEIAVADEPTVVQEWRNTHPGVPTVREYCLKPKQMVTLAVQEVSHWLPPEVEGGRPVEDIYRQVHVRVEGAENKSTAAQKATP